MRWLSSSAKADDPVFVELAFGTALFNNAVREYWMPAFAGMTPE
jgi:hypothetical protein